MERITIEKMPEVKNENLIHLNRYVKFINSRPERDLKKNGLWEYEIHHIIPRSLNGLENNNLIKLSLREHFISHMILWKCGYSSMTYAFLMMNTLKRYKTKLNSRQYSNLKHECAKLCKNAGHTKIGNVYCTNGEEVFYFETPIKAKEKLGIQPNSRMLYENRNENTNRLFCGKYNNKNLIWGFGNELIVSKEKAIENYNEQCKFKHDKKSKRMTGKKYTIERRINIGKSRIYPKGKDNPCYGKKRQKLK